MRLQVAQAVAVVGFCFRVDKCLGVYWNKGSLSFFFLVTCVSQLPPLTSCSDAASSRPSCRSASVNASLCLSLATVIRCAPFFFGGDGCRRGGGRLGGGSVSFRCFQNLTFGILPMPLFKPWTPSWSGSHLESLCWSHSQGPCCSLIRGPDDDRRQSRSCCNYVILWLLVSVLISC